MALIALQDEVFVWQKVKQALSGANPATFDAFRTFRVYMATQGQYIQLQFLPIDGIYSSSDGGNNASQVLMDSACTVYGIYLAKLGATETIFKGSNSTTTAGTDGTQDLAIAMTAAGDVFEIYPKGRAMSTGLTVTEDTTRTGSTLTLKANSASGFVVIGS